LPASRAQKWCGDAQLLIDARPFLALAADGASEHKGLFCAASAEQRAFSFLSLCVCPKTPGMRALREYHGE
jgi:hypothetical protein